MNALMRQIWLFPRDYDEICQQVYYPGTVEQGEVRCLLRRGHWEVCRVSNEYFLFQGHEFDRELVANLNKMHERMTGHDCDTCTSRTCILIKNTRGDIACETTWMCHIMAERLLDEPMAPWVRAFP